MPARSSRLRRADEFFRAPKHPYARLLLRALPDAQRRGESLAAIRGTVPPLWLSVRGLPLRAALRPGLRRLRRRRSRR